MITIWFVLLALSIFIWHLINKKNVDFYYYPCVSIGVSFLVFLVFWLMNVQEVMHDSILNEDGSEPGLIILIWNFLGINFLGSWISMLDGTHSDGNTPPSNSSSNNNPFGNDGYDVKTANFLLAKEHMDRLSGKDKK